MSLNPLMAGTLGSRFNHVEGLTFDRRVILANAATLALTEADSGSLIVLSRAAGVAVTLPLAREGLVFDFVILTSVTSNAYSVTAGETTDLFVGGLIVTDGTGATLDLFKPDVTDDDALSMNGSTTGGLIGSSFRFTGLSSTRWYVEGHVSGSGTGATPFA